MTNTADHLRWIREENQAHAAIQHALIAHAGSIRRTIKEYKEQSPTPPEVDDISAIAHLNITLALAERILEDVRTRRLRIEYNRD